MHFDTSGVRARRGRRRGRSLLPLLALASASGLALVMIWAATLVASPPRPQAALQPDAGSSSALATALPYGA